MRKSIERAAEPPEPARRLEQADLGVRYRLRGRLRRRAGLPVLLAVDETDGQLVAIKAAGEPDAAGAEAEALEALDHPGVVRLRDRLEIDGQPWLVLDYVAGDTLEARLRAEGPLAPEAVAGLLRQLGAALGHVHAAGYLHRDLKPANVLIDDQGRAVIIDFGSACALSAEGGTAGAATLSEGYGAPEQYLEGAGEGPWTDVYALGAIGFRALTGALPPAALDRLDRGVALELPSADGAPALIRALERALALDPEDRPQTAAELLALLDPGEPTRAMEDGDEGPPTVRIRRRPGRRQATLETAPAVPGPPSRPRLGPWLIALALILIGLVAGAWAARPLYDRHIKTTWLVDPAGGGDVATIAEALDRAGDGARIVVRAGTYPESLVLGRAADLVAAEGDDPPVLAPPAGPCLLTTVSGASLQGFVLEGSDTAGVACLAISGGNLRVEDSRIVASAGPAIEVRAGATPEISGGEIRGAGVVVREGSQPVVQDVTIEGIEGPSLIVRSGAAPEVTGNRIATSGPVIFAEGAAGAFTGNQITNALTNAIEIASGAAPTVRDNQIAEPAEAGVFIYGEGQARLESNRIESSGLSAVVVSEEGRAALFDNELHGSGEHGVLVLDGATVVLENNLIENSRGRGIAIGPDAEAELDGNRMTGNRSGAVLDARSRGGSGDGGA